MSDMTNEQRRLEAESWKQWETAWGNTESGAHAFGWLNGYKAGQAASEAARAALVAAVRQIIAARSGQYGNVWHATADAEVDLLEALAAPPEATP